MRASGQLTKVYPFLLGELSHSLKVHWAAKKYCEGGNYPQKQHFWWK